MRQIYESALVHVSCSAGKLSLSTRRPPLHTRYMTPLFVVADKMMVKFVGGHLERKEIARLRIWRQRQMTVDLRKKNATTKVFPWIELAIYPYLTWKRTPLFQIFLGFDFSKKREKSIVNS